MITREELKTYIKIKSKIGTVDSSTQTDENMAITDNNGNGNGIVIINPQQVCIGVPSALDINGGDGDDDEYDEDEDDASCDCDEDEEDETRSDDQEEKIKIKRKRKFHYSSRDEDKYYQKLPKKQKQYIDNLEDDIVKVNYVQKPMRFRILESNMDLKLKAMAINKLEQLYTLDPSAGEYYKLSTYIENMCKIPIGKYQKMSIDSTNSVDEISDFLDNTRKKLDATVYGHDDAKSQIIRLLAKWISNKDSKGLVIALQGSPGVGKTVLCKSIADAIGLPMGFISLGGMASTDSSILLGHSQTYEGSRWGKIVDVVMQAQCMNPVIFFDELDKVSNTRHGEEIINVLIHMTDSSQNDVFHDRYYCDIDLDLSKCLIVFSYNNEEAINPILKDRLVTIHTSGYKVADKVQIAKKHLLPTIYKEYGIQDEEIKIDDDALKYIITLTEEEEGVRNFQRSLDSIISELNLIKLLKKDEYTFPLTVTNDIVDDFIQKKKQKDWPAAHMYL